MAISITVDNDRTTTPPNPPFDPLLYDETAGVQTPATTDDGNEINVTLTAEVGGTLGGFAAAFNTFLNSAGLGLSDAQKIYARDHDGASSSSTFVLVTTSAGETISDLFFANASGGALAGVQVVGMQTLDGQNVYLWSNGNFGSSGDFCVATTSNVAGAGEVVAAFYLNEAGDHKSAQVQMVVFEPLNHPNGSDPDDALNFTDALRVGASGSLSFDFDQLASQSSLWVAVGNSNEAVLISGSNPDIDNTTGKKTNDSDVIHTSQGGLNATIGVNNQLFDNVGESATFTLVTGLQGLVGADAGVLSDYVIDDPTSGGVEQGIAYDGYLQNVLGAGIFISQDQGSPGATKSLDINVFATNNATEEEGFGYVYSNPGTKTGDALGDDTPVNVTSVTITNNLGVDIGTWVLGADPDGAGPLRANGATVAGVQVTITGNNIDVNNFGIQYTISWTTASAFNRFNVVNEAGKWDIGRVDVDRAVPSNTPVGDKLFVEDDGPSISGTLTGAPNLTVDESAFGTNDTKAFAGQFTPVYGTDGQGATPVTYALSTPGGNSGLVDTLTLQNVVLSKNLVTGNIEGRTATSNDLVFLVSVDGSGNVTLDQSRAVVHIPNSGNDQSTTLSAANLVVLTATAHDGDTDTASAGINIGTLLNFKDDSPIIASQIQNATVNFVVGASAGSSLNGQINADNITNANDLNQAGVFQYIITSFSEPKNVFPDLDGVLSADGTKVTYYSTSVTANQNASTAVYELTLNQDANSEAGSYTFTVLQLPPVTNIAFDFEDLPSGQNLLGVIAVDKTDLSKGGLLVFPSNPDLNPDGTFTNASGTINTSKGGGPVTIGNGNQAFDDPSEGAYFLYVDNPNAASVGGVGLTQTGADDADTIRFNGTNEAFKASVEVVQASGAGTVKRPGPAMSITAYDANPGDVNSDALARAEVGNPTVPGSNQGSAADEVNIIGVKIFDENGALIEYRLVNQAAGAANGGILQDSGDAGTDVTAADDSLVGIQFILDDPGGAGTADDIYSVVVSNLKQNYTIEWETGVEHDLSLVQNVSGSFDIGGFNIFNQANVPAQDFSFSVQISDYDNDVFGGPSQTFANFGVHINGIIFA